MTGRTNCYISGRGLRQLTGGSKKRRELGARRKQKRKKRKSVKRGVRFLKRRNIPTRKKVAKIMISLLLPKTVFHIAGTISGSPTTRSGLSSIELWMYWSPSSIALSTRRWQGWWRLAGDCLIYPGSTMRRMTPSPRHIASAWLPRL